MFTRHKLSRQRRLGPHHADRQSTADGFSQRENIRLHRQMLMSKPFSGSSTAGPNFVEDQCDLPVIAKLAIRRL